MLDTQNMTKLIRRLSWFALSAVVVIGGSVGALFMVQTSALEDLAAAREFARVARVTASQATDRETSVRGYLITGDDKSLLRNNIGKAQLPGSLDSMAAMAASDKTQSARVRAAADALARWDLEFATPAAEGRLSAESAILAGKPLFDVVRSRFDTLIGGADARFERLSTRARRVELLAMAVLLAELVVFFGVLLYLIRGRLVGQAIDLARQQELLEQQAVELELQMDETAQVNQSLSTSLAETQQKDLELRKSLKQREETAAFLDSALTSAPVGFAFWDCELRFIRANGLMAGLHELAPEQLVGTKLADFAPEIAAQVDPVLRGVIQSRQAARNVEIIRPASRTIPALHTEVTFYPVVSPEGGLLAVGAVISDVTEARNREERVRRSEERYRYVAKATNDVVYEWDIATNEFQWSEGMLDLFGYAPEDVENSPNWITELVHPEDVQRITDTFAGAFSTGAERWQQEYRLRRKDGKYASVEGRAYILRDAKGEPTKVIGAITDRSPQQSLEEQLRQSQKMDAVGRLAGGIAHDFNNILTVIRMSSEFLLQDLPESNESRHEAGEIMRAADRAAALTRQLLAFSRHQVLNPRTIVLNEVVEEIQGMVKRVVPENITVTTTLEPRLDAIKADTGQIEQVILNLVINAADAMPGGGRLDIRTSNVQVDEAFSATHLGVKTGDYVCLTVSDTGHGMDKETVTRIFEPFFTTKPVGKGTGLGLATVHGIVTQTGGKVWVYSEPGHGTTFKIFIPITRDVARIVTPRSVKQFRPATELILLVEDEAATREAVERSLIRAGYRVVLAANGLEGLKVAAQNRNEIDLVLTDSMMPEMSGLEMVSRLRQTRPDIRVLMMSGYTEKMSASRFGLSDQPFIEKPFAAADLLAAVQRVLHGERAA
jgi:PAS domain S-box-containing protein